jgi:addiction module RelE/StbE family toxin
VVQVIWAKSALADLQSVHDYIARDSARYAQLTVERIRQAAARLQRFPMLGHFSPDLEQPQYRQLVVGSYRVIYRVDENQRRVLILAVVHASRNMPPITEP